MLCQQLKVLSLVQLVIPEPHLCLWLFMKPHSFLCLFRCQASSFSPGTYAQGTEMARKSLKPQRRFLSKSEVSSTGWGQDGVWWGKLSIVLFPAVRKILFKGSRQEPPKWACVWIWFKKFLVWRVKFIIWKSHKMTACSAHPGISDLSKEDRSSLQWCRKWNTKIAGCWNNRKGWQSKIF